WRKTATQLRRASTTQRHGSRKSGRCAHCGTQRPTGTGSHSERGCTQRATVISNIEGERRNVAQTPRGCCHCEGVGSQGHCRGYGDRETSRGGRGRRYIDGTSCAVTAEIRTAA